MDAVRLVPGQVGGVVVTGGGSDVEVCAGDGGAEFGAEFLGGVGVVSEAAGEVSGESGRVSGPVAQLVGGGAVEAGGVDELVPVLNQAIADDTVVIVDCPVDYGENMKLTAKLGELVCPI